MEGIKWSSSGFLCVLAANNLDFGLAQAEICQTLGQQQCQEDMAWPKSARHSLHNMLSSSIWPILMISNGPAVVSYVSLLKTILILAWLWLKSAKLWAGNSVKRIWHVQNQHGIAFITLEDHSFDPYGGYQMVPQQWFPMCAGCKQSWFRLGPGWTNLPNLGPATVPRGHDLCKISHK